MTPGEEKARDEARTAFLRREVMAGVAMLGLTIQASVTPPPSTLASDAYAIADAMIAKGGPMP